MLSIYKVAEGAAPPAARAVSEVAAALRRGELALIPTETVYGLSVAVEAFAGADADAAATGVAPAGDGAVDACVANAEAAAANAFGEPAVAPADADGDTVPAADAAGVAGSAASPASAPVVPCVNGDPVPAEPTGYRRIFSVKQRALTQTVPWLVAGVDALDRYGVDVAPEIRALAEAFWPGALTVVVPAAPSVPRFMQAADGTVALRASASPVVQALVRSCGSPLATTSANTHGAPAPAAFADVEARVLAGVDIAVDAGATTCRDASTIVAMAGGRVRILRHGALADDAIDAALSERFGAGHASAPDAAPDAAAPTFPLPSPTAPAREKGAL